MNLFDNLVILDDDVSQHLVQSDSGLHLQLLRALVDHSQDLGNQLLLGLWVTLEDRLAISKDIALLIVIGLFQ